ncbi:hypothetical protein HYW74_00160 [Candidatus Pacearchaeota archaeon]|nr:hypothetical protein [Candidatus Pacearchaeota archaeon]
MKKKRGKTKVKPIRHLRSELKSKNFRRTSHNIEPNKNYKSKKLFFTIIWFTIIFLLILLILLFIYNLDLKNIKQNFKQEVKLSPAYNGLPEGFTPKFGYWHKNPAQTNSQGIVGLWDANGNAYFSNDGIVFNIWPNQNKINSNLSVDFKPVIGYYQGFPGQETILLWNSSRSIYAWNYQTQKFILISSGMNNNPVPAGQLPGNFIPIVGYWHNFAGGRIIIWNESTGYVAGSNGVFSRLLTNPGGENNAPKVAYYFNISGYAGVRAWIIRNSGQVALYEFNASTGPGFVEVTQIPIGLPTNRAPTAGYFDKIRNKSVLWYGAEVYESSNEITFTRIGGSSCTPDCNNKQCGDSDGCEGICDVDSSCNEGYTCSNGECTQFLTSSLCRDSDDGASAQGYYTKGNVTYPESNINITKNDSCLNSTALVEWYCVGDIGVNETYNCPSSCSNSVCTGIPEESCIDSDNGLTFGTSGFVNYSLNSISEIHNDSCIDEFQLKEYYCDENNQTTSLLYGCLETQSCSDGNCVSINGNENNSNDNPPPTPTGDCTDEEEYCEGDYYILCANGRWLEPARVSGKCNYQVSNTGTNPENSDTSSSLSGGKKSNFWIYFSIIFFFILILIIGGIIAFVMAKKNKGNKQMKGQQQYSPPAQPIQQFTPRPPPYPPQQQQLPSQQLPPRQYPPSDIPSRSPPPQRIFERSR